MTLTNEVQATYHAPIFRLRMWGLWFATGDITNVNTWVDYFLVETTMDGRLLSLTKM